MNNNEILTIMPELKGTEKQVAWANDIRKKSLNSFQVYNPENESYTKAATEILMNELKKRGYKFEFTEETKKLKFKEVNRKLAEIEYNEIIERIATIKDASTFIRHKPSLSVLNLFPDLNYLRYYEDGSFPMAMDERYYEEGKEWKI